MLDQHTIEDDNPYSEWWAFHSNPEHREGLNKALELLDRQAAKSTEHQKKIMVDIFMTSVQHETMLWDEYYNMSHWETYPTD